MRLEDEMSALYTANQKLYSDDSKIALVWRTFTAGGGGCDDAGDVTVTSSLRRFTGFRGCSDVDWIHLFVLLSPCPADDGGGGDDDGADFCSTRALSSAIDHHSMKNDHRRKTNLILPLLDVFCCGLSADFQWSILMTSVTFISITLQSTLRDKNCTHFWLILSNRALFWQHKLNILEL